MEVAKLVEGELMIEVVMIITYMIYQNSKRLMWYTYSIPVVVVVVVDVIVAVVVVVLV